MGILGSNKIAPIQPNETSRTKVRPWRKNAQQRVIKSSMFENQNVVLTVNRNVIESSQVCVVGGCRFTNKKKAIRQMF